MKLLNVRISSSFSEKPIKR